MKTNILITALLTCVLLAACAPGAGPTATPYPTFTPLAGFRILGIETPQPVSSPTAAIAASPTPLIPPTETPLPTPTLEPSPTPTDRPQPLITMTFTGQIVPARCVQAETDRLGQADYIYADVVDLLSASDLTIGALNASLTDYPPATGCIETFVLIGRPIQADAMAAAGMDVMSVATNHIKNCGLSNCGDRAFLDTLENLRRVNILPVGAGQNLAEAAAPVFIEISGIRFGFVSLGQIEPLAFAGENTPGIGILTEESLRSAIAAARAEADVVIFLPHWGPEYTHYPNASQRALAVAAVEAGADLVVGNHTHYIQSYLDIADVPVYFGLGNFVFDQTQEPQRQQSLLVRITFQGTEIVAREIIPVVNDRTGRVRLANQDEVVQILTVMQQVNETVKRDFD